LQWKPEVTFEEGVARLLAGIEDWSAAPVWTPATISDATREWFQYLGH
jgi:UDP-glucose 4-epimerase